MRSKKVAKKRGAAASGATNGSAHTLLRAIAKSLLVSLIFMLVLSLPAAGAAYAGADPDAMITPMALSVLALGATAMGWCMRRYSHAPAWGCGALGGGVLLLLLGICQLFLPDGARTGTSFPLLFWGGRVGAILFCLLGAMMAANAPGRRKKRRRRS